MKQHGRLRRRPRIQSRGGAGNKIAEGPEPGVPFRTRLFTANPAEPQEAGLGEQHATPWGRVWGRRQEGGAARGGGAVTSNRALEVQPEVTLRPLVAQRNPSWGPSVKDTPVETLVHPSQSPLLFCQGPAPHLASCPTPVRGGCCRGGRLSPDAPPLVWHRNDSPRYPRCLLLQNTFCSGLNDPCPQGCPKS